MLSQSERKLKELANQVLAEGVQLSPEEETSVRAIAEWKENLDYPELATYMGHRIKEGK